MINERAQTVLNESTNEKNDILIKDDENNLNDEKTFRADKFLTEAQRFKVQKFLNTSDMRYVFWQVWAIDKSTENKKSVRKNNVDYNVNFDEMIAAKNAEWRKQLLSFMTDDRIQYVESTKKFIQEYKDIQTYFDNLRYQRQNLKKSCKLLNIVYREESIVYRTKNMTLFQQLKFWQVIAIKIIANFYRNEWFRDCIIADTVDLKKIWTIVEFLLWMSESQLIFWSWATFFLSLSQSTFFISQITDFIVIVYISHCQRLHVSLS